MTRISGALAAMLIAAGISACGGRVRIVPSADDRDAETDGARSFDAASDGGAMDAVVADVSIDDDASPLDAATIDDAGAMDASAIEDAIAREDGTTADGSRPDAWRVDAGMCVPPGIGRGCPCDDGLVCDDGVCRARCDGSACCADVGIECVEATEPGGSVCTEGCALEDDPVCGPGLGCRFFHPDESTRVLTFCGAVDDTKRDGDPCTTNDECPRGGTCVSAGYCVTYCRSEPGSCGDDRTCLNFRPHALLGSTEHGYCSSRCTYVPDEGCVAGTTCLPLIDSRFGPARYYAQCRVVGAGGDGAPCTSYLDCSAGRLCVASACRAMCRIDGFDCPSGESCRSLDPALATPTGEVGVCGA